MPDPTLTREQLDEIERDPDWATCEQIVALVALARRALDLGDDLPSLLAGCERAIALDNLLVDISTERDMAEAYYKDLEVERDAAKHFGGMVSAELDSLRTRHARLVEAARKALAQNSACKELERALSEETP